jgi:acetyl-CoA synthetase
MSYGIISPLCNRVTMVVDEAEFDLDRWYSILEREGCRSGTPHPPPSA